MAAESVQPVTSLAKTDGLARWAAGAEELSASAQDALAALGAALDPTRHPRLRRVLQLLGLANARVHQALQELAPLAADRLAAQVVATGAEVSSGSSGGNAHAHAATAGDLLAAEGAEEESVLQDGFKDFRCSVDRLPFGLQITAPHGQRPRVVDVLKGSPAERAGVQRDDVLVEVAGNAVKATTWFAFMQQATPPYGLLFQRPVKDVPS